MYLHVGETLNKIKLITNTMNYISINAVFTIKQVHYPLQHMLMNILLDRECTFN